MGILRVRVLYGMFYLDGSVSAIKLSTNETRENISSENRKEMTRWGEVLGFRFG